MPSIKSQLLALAFIAASTSLCVGAAPADQYFETRDIADLDVLYTRADSLETRDLLEDLYVRGPRKGGKKGGRKGTKSKGGAAGGGGAAPPAAAGAQAAGAARSFIDYLEVRDSLEDLYARGRKKGGKKGGRKGKKSKGGAAGAAAAPGGAAAGGVAAEGAAAGGAAGVAQRAFVDYLEVRDLFDRADEFYAREFEGLEGLD